MLEFKDVSFRYPGGPVIIPGLSFKIEKGEFVALAGSNGAGKSTISRLSNGLLLPTAGEVTVGGFNTKATRASQIARKAGFLFQNPDRQICQNTTREEIAFGMRVQGLPEEEVKARTEEALKTFGLDGDRSPFTRSRGERQRIALASVLVGKPELVILDEPTTGLDYRECMAMMARVRSLNAAGTTVVMVCHDMELVLDFAHRVLVLCEGALLLDGETRAVFRNEAVLRQASVLPPQITRLSLRLADCLPPADTAEEMEAAVRAAREGRVPA